MKNRVIATGASAFFAVMLCLAMVPSPGVASDLTQGDGAGKAPATTVGVSGSSNDVELTEDAEAGQETATKNTGAGNNGATQKSEVADSIEMKAQEELENTEAADEAPAAEAVSAESSDADAKAAADAKVAAEVSKGDVSAFLDTASGPTVAYRTHVQTYGWEGGFATNGAQSGTTGEAKRLEAIQIGVRVPGVSGGVRYFVHRQTYGWESGWKYDGEQSGTTGEAKRLEAIRIELTGDLAKQYDIWYRVHVQTFGWEGWVKNGAQAGTTGLAKRLEGIEVRLVRKGAEQLSPVSGALVNYNVHCQTFGWLDTVADGAEAGTTGLAKRLEGIHIKLGSQVAGGIEYCTHVQTHGWMSWQKNGQMSGTTGEAKRLEAIQVRLTDGAQDKYDVWYCVHAQSYGWLGWAKNGEKAGTAGLAKRLESIKIKVLPKGSAAPGTTNNHFIAEGDVPIMGNSKATQSACVAHYKSISRYPGNVYASKGAASIEDFVRIIFEEARAEGVRADVVYAQSMLETNYLRFGGDVSAGQCNFAGIGATGGVPGNSFENVRMGLRAQVQHLKAYASTDPLNNTCVDPRFNLVSRGIAPMLDGLSQRWAGGSDYGESIGVILNNVISMS